MTNEAQEADRLLEKAEHLLEQAEEIIEEVVDLEECAKAGRKPPPARIYRFKVNETVCTWDAPTILGRQILERAGLVPPDQYTLREKIAGQPPKRIELDETVDLRKHGIEKFRAIRREQHEGEYEGRRAAPVLDQDRLFLDRYGLRWEVIADGSTWVLLHDFVLPPGYSADRVTVAIRVESGYPITALDMMYVYPAITRADGRPIPQTNCLQALDGKQFQRWSRHRTPTNPWIPGEDSLETHVYLIEEYFRAGVTLQ
jgi:hypothetical protein